MMHYIDQCEVMHYIDQCEVSNSANDKITAAISMYEKSKQMTQDRLAEKLTPIKDIIGMTAGADAIQSSDDVHANNPMDKEFSSVYGPNQMRCLALVSHNGMKETSKFPKQGFCV